jgi:hypothetical protein
MTNNYLNEEDEFIASEIPAYKGESSAIYSFIIGLVERSRTDEAKKHAQILNDLGYVEANGHLAEVLYGLDALNSPKVKENHEEFFRLMLPWAESNREGYAEASFLVGDLYERLDQLETAFKYFLRAADAGHEEAAIALGYAYIEALGVDRDVVEGAHWFMKSLKMKELDSYVTNSCAWPVTRNEGWVDASMAIEMLDGLSAEKVAELSKVINISSYKLICFADPMYPSDEIERRKIENILLYSVLKDEFKGGLVDAGDCYVAVNNKNGKVAFDWYQNADSLDSIGM